MEHEVSRANLVLLGADLVYSGGALLNKIGSRPLARAAHQRGVPTIVVTGSSKFVLQRPRGPPPRHELFDRTPARWITEYWTEAGPIRPAAIRSQISARRRGIR
jgi:translation initiation factor 2B subunit (eIF-2B alpha/beta/delta family)